MRRLSTSLIYSGTSFTRKGHPSHKCPDANAEAVNEYEEKMKARNQARQLRRLGGNCAVSDDEDEEEWDEDDEAGAALGSVKSKACFRLITLPLPHRIHYTRSLSALLPLCVSTLQPAAYHGHQ